MTKYLIVGLPGAGKTMLLTEVARRASRLINAKQPGTKITNEKLGYIS